MVVEDVRVRARRELERAGISVESAPFIVGDRPSGGWDALATKDDLARFATKDDLARFATKDDITALRLELHHEIHELTRWMATLVIGAMSVSIASSALIGAALRFA